jgi:hypothetical protein
MLENKKIHTSILTLDKKTVLAARTNPFIQQKLAILIAQAGFENNGTVRADGLYFKKVALI